MTARLSLLARGKNLQKNLDNEEKKKKEKNGLILVVYFNLYLYYHLLWSIYGRNNR